jgi:hypothetical protein
VLANERAEAMHGPLVLVAVTEVVIAELPVEHPRGLSSAAMNTGQCEFLSRAGSTCRRSGVSDVPREMTCKAHPTSSTKYRD